MKNGLISAHPAGSLELPGGARAAWVVFGLMGLLLFSGCAKSGPAPARPVMAVPVRTALVVQKDVPVQLQEFGTCEALATVAIKSLVNGQIVKVHFVEGHEVKKGDLLFSIDPRPFEAALRQAEATLNRDAALAENARLEARRAEELIKTESAPQRQLDQAKAAEAATQAAVSADAAAVENARLQVEYCSIRSPIDGRAGDLIIHEGNIVKANDATQVVIHQIRPIYVSFSVPEKYLPLIKQYLAQGNLPVETTVPGQAAYAERGQLAFVDNAVDAATGTIRLKGKFENASQRLWPGQFVNVSLTLVTQTNAILVASQAVESGQKGQYVFVVKPDSTVAYRPVVIGRIVGSEIVIEQGLQPGERVVTDGQLQLVDGSKIEARAEEQESPAERL
jgi:membrane fusion protein, multidrug efflux system